MTNDIHLRFNIDYTHYKNAIHVQPHDYNKLLLINNK